MEIIISICYYLLSFIISVGDVILVGVMYIYHLLLVISTYFIKNVFLAPVTQAMHIKKKKNKNIFFFPFPIFPKIKYFFLSTVFSFYMPCFWNTSKENVFYKICTNN